MLTLGEKKIQGGGKQGPRKPKPALLRSTMNVI